MTIHQDQTNLKFFPLQLFLNIDIKNKIILRKFQGNIKNLNNV